MKSYSQQNNDIDDSLQNKTGNSRSQSRRAFPHILSGVPIREALRVHDENDNLAQTGTIS